MQHAGLHGADAKDQRGDQHDAHDGSRLGLSGCVKTRSDEGWHQQGREQGRHCRQPAHDQHYQVRDRTGQPPGSLQLVVGQIPGKDRDECRRQRTAGHHRVEKVGKFEGRIVSVQVGPDAKLAGNDYIPQ